jgi:hypothetical protein
LPTLLGLCSYNSKILFSDQETEDKSQTGHGHIEKDYEDGNQVGSGTAMPKKVQSGTGSSASMISNEDEFVNKIAILVTKKIQPRLPETIWNNFSLTSPNTSMIEPSNTSPPIHYNNTINKDDENDMYGKTLLEILPIMSKK